jgi:hypothetical protein
MDIWYTLTKVVLPVPDIPITMMQRFWESVCCYCIILYFIYYKSNYIYIIYSIIYTIDE